MTPSIRPWHNVVAAVLGLTMVSGVYLDGWAHLTRPGLETFFTPWHAILYSGFALLATFIVYLSVDRTRRRLSPPGAYRLALIGVAVFLAGGVGDMIWHEIFGIEAGVDALLSPTHLVLLTGGMLMLTAPARAAAAGSSAGQIAATALSIAATAALAAFFLSYLSVFADPTPVFSPLPTIPEGAPGHREAELPIIVGLGSYLVTTAAFLVPLLALRRIRGQVPFGVPTAVVAVVAVLGSLLGQFRFVAPVFGAAIGAAVFDVTMRLWPQLHTRWLVLGAALPALVWTGQLTGLALTEDIEWTVELWAGVVALTALAGAGLALSTSNRE
jgi:hypothetical protein